MKEFPKVDKKERNKATKIMFITFFNINNSFLILNIKGGRFCAVCNFCFLPSETFFFRLLSS